MRSLLVPALYETVILGSTRACQSGLKLPSEAWRWVRKLAIRPNYYLSWPKADKAVDEGQIASSLVQVTSQGLLNELHTFDWDGNEMAPDLLWDALRVGCPALRTVSSNVGYNPIAPGSSMWRFRNLRAFSLTVRHGLEGDLLFPELESLPREMWDMLIIHCPNLEELNLCSFSPSTRLFDLSPLTTMGVQWPSLTSVVLGCFGYQHDFTMNCDLEAMSAWVGRHPGLVYARMVWSFKRWVSPESQDIPSLPSPALDSYAGIYQQIPLMSAASLTMLDLMTEPIYDARVAGLCPVLRVLPKLEILDIWMQVSDCTYVEAVLSSCTELREFHFMCTTVGEWGHGLGGLLVLHVPHLKVFSLTEGWRWTGKRKAMVKLAAGIVRMNERLDQVNVRWVRERCRGHLKEEGRYDVVKEVQGKVAGLVVSERGFNLMGRTFVRSGRFMF